MKRYKVLVTETAQKDLVDIVEYLSGPLSNPKAAHNIIDEFKQLVDSLEELPSAHARVRDELLAVAGYHWSPVGSYMAFFTIDEPAATVTVERILHGTRNWKNIV